MAGPGLCGDSSMGDTERAVFQDPGAEERRKGSGRQVVVGIGVRFGEGLESLVGAQTITYIVLAATGQERQRGDGR